MKLLSLFLLISSPCFSQNDTLLKREQFERDFKSFNQNPYYEAAKKNTDLRLLKSYRINLPYDSSERFNFHINNLTNSKWLIRFPFKK